MYQPRGEPRKVMHGKRTAFTDTEGLCGVCLDFSVERAPSAQRLLLSVALPSFSHLSLAQRPPVLEVR